MICVYALSHDVASVFRDRMLASASGSLTWRDGDGERERERYTYHIAILFGEHDVVTFWGDGEPSYNNDG